MVLVSLPVVSISQTVAPRVPISKLPCCATQIERKPGAVSDNVFKSIVCTGAIYAFHLIIRPSFDPVKNWVAVWLTIYQIASVWFLIGFAADVPVHLYKSPVEAPVNSTPFNTYPQLVYGTQPALSILPVAALQLDPVNVNIFTKSAPVAANSVSFFHWASNTTA